MIGPSSLSVIVAGAALAAAALALLSAILAWRAAERLVRRADELTARLHDAARPTDHRSAAQPADAIAPVLQALRDDLALLFAHVSSLTSGQLDLRQIVGGVVERQLSPLLDRLDESDSRADKRTALLRQRLELVQEALQDVADDAAAQTAATAAAAQTLARLDAAIARAADAGTTPAAEGFPARPRAPAGFETGRLSIVPAARRETDA
jgi:hypothetical protein